MTNLDDKIIREIMLHGRGNPASRQASKRHAVQWPVDDREKYAHSDALQLGMDIQMKLGVFDEGE